MIPIIRRTYHKLLRFFVCLIIAESLSQFWLFSTDMLTDFRESKYCTHYSKRSLAEEVRSVLHVHNITRKVSFVISSTFAVEWTVNVYMRQRKCTRSSTNTCSKHNNHFRRPSRKNHAHRPCQIRFVCDLFGIHRSCIMLNVHTHIMILQTT